MASLAHKDPVEAPRTPGGAPADVLFHRLQPMPSAQPRSKFTCLPVLGAVGRACEPAAPHSRFLAPDCVFTVSGKAATYLALRDAGVGEGDDVLVPAYHCPTMIHPVLALRARPVLLSVEDDLAVTLRTCRDARTPRTRALLLPHFFAAMQPEIEAIRQWCAASHCVLIEDCAHAFYGAGANGLPGSFGDYAIASTRKFFVGSEGGALVRNGAAYDRPLRRTTLVEEARGAYQVIEEAALYGLFGPRMQARAAREFGGVGPPSDEAAHAESMPACAADEEIDAARLARRATRLTAAIIRHSDHARIAGVRRSRYLRWADAIAGLRGVAPFHRPPASDMIPYVFPVRLLRPREQFTALRYAGVAVWRWDKLAQSACRTSARLALELIQLPCQHTLSDEAFEAQLDAFRRAIESAA